MNELYLKTLRWCSDKKIDYVSRLVFCGLVKYYELGQRHRIFFKLQQLVNDEHYELAAKLHSLIMYLKIKQDAQPEAMEPLPGDESES